MSEHDHEPEILPFYNEARDAYVARSVLTMAIWQAERRSYDLTMMYLRAVAETFVAEKRWEEAANGPIPHPWDRAHIDAFETHWLTAKELLLADVMAEHGLKADVLETYVEHTLSLLELKADEIHAQLEMDEDAQAAELALGDASINLSQLMVILSILPDEAMERHRERLDRVVTIMTEASQLLNEAYTAESDTVDTPSDEET